MYMTPKNARPSYNSSQDITVDKPHNVVCIVSLSKSFCYMVPGFDLCALS